MSDTKAQWYISSQGQQSQKPYTTDQVRAGCQSGKIPADTLCWREGMQDWLPLAQIAEFQDVAAAPSPPPIAPPPPSKGAGIDKVRDKLKAGAGNVKKRAQMVKLNHDIKNLQKALQQQLYALGYQATQQPPEQVDISVEMTELTQIQIQLNEKQTTLASLQQTAGSETVAKQMKQEIAQLQKRQQELVVAIGAKINIARPELPDLAGNYGAIDQLRAAIQPKQAELEQLQTEIGPIEFDKETLFSVGKAGRKYLPYGIGAIAVILILYFGIGWVWGLFSPAGWKEFQYYVSDDVSSFTYTNLTNLRKSNLFEDKVDSITSGLKRNDLDIDVDDIEEIIKISSKDVGSIQVFKTSEDLYLEDMVKSTGKINTETYKDIDYVLLGRGYSGCLAKTEKKTYCLARNKEAMEEAIKHLDKEEKPEFDEYFQEALEHVEKLDRYKVSLGSGDAKASGDGFSVGSSVKDKEIKLFRQEKDAEKVFKELKKIIERNKEDLEDAIEDADDKDLKKYLETKLSFLEASKQSQSGNAWKGEWSYDTDELEDLADDKVTKTAVEEGLAMLP